MLETQHARSKNYVDF